MLTNKNQFYSVISVQRNTNNLCDFHIFSIQVLVRGHHARRASAFKQNPAPIISEYDGPGV